MSLRTILGFSLLLLFACSPSKPSSLNPIIIKEDIAHFWNAYDAIHSTNDTTLHIELLQTLFLDKASDGQKRMIAARNYTADEYVEAITNYPNFWNSLRDNTNQIETHSQEIISGIEKLHQLYPIEDPAKIYFTMGVFRSPGTGVDSFALIGSEYALGDSNTIIHELNEHQQNYFKMNPIEHLQILMVHEYLHTLQKPIPNDFLGQTIYEGIAEFLAQKATGKPTPHQAFTYGPEHEEKVFDLFERDMFRSYARFSWLWNNTNNEFGTNDMAYYVGHHLAMRYYEQALDKDKAIKDLIELDYEDSSAVYGFLDQTERFTKSMALLQSDFESSRPYVSKIEPSISKNQKVDPETKTITIQFSEPLNGRNTSIDYGPLGVEAFPKMSFDRKWSEDFKAWTIPITLEPNKHYQFMVGENFRNENGDPLRPYLVEFYTKK